jgi:hypothetical protein
VRYSAGRTGLNNSRQARIQGYSEPHLFNTSIAKNPPLWIRTKQ